MRSLKIFSGIIVFVPILVGLLLGHTAEANPTSSQPSESLQGKAAVPTSDDAKRRTEAAYLAGTGAERERNHAAAESAYQSALKLARENRLTQLEGASLHRLAVLKAKENKAAESEQLFRQAKPLCEDSVVFHCDYAKLYMDQKRFQNAETVLKAGALLAPNDRRVLYNLGYVIAMQPDRQTEGLRYLKLALGEKKAYEELSKIYRFQGNEGQADFARQRAEQIDADQPLPEISSDIQNRIRKELSWHESKMMVSELNKAAAEKEDREKQVSQNASQNIVSPFADPIRAETSPAEQLVLQTKPEQPVAPIVKALPDEEQTNLDRTKNPRALPAEETEAESNPVQRTSPIIPDPFLIAVQTTSKDGIIPQNKAIKSLPVNEENFEPTSDIQNEQTSVRSLPGGQAPAPQQIVQNTNIPTTITKIVGSKNPAPNIALTPTNDLRTGSDICNEKLRQEQHLSASNAASRPGPEHPAFAIDRNNQITFEKRNSGPETNPIRTLPTVPASERLGYQATNEAVAAVEQPQPRQGTATVASQPTMQSAKTNSVKRPQVNPIPLNTAIEIEREEVVANSLRSERLQNSIPAASDVLAQQNSVQYFESNRPVENRHLNSDRQAAAIRRPVESLTINERSSRPEPKKLEFVAKPANIQTAENEDGALPMLAFRTTERIAHAEQPTFSSKPGPSFEVRQSPVAMLKSEGPQKRAEDGMSAPMPEFAVRQPIEKSIAPHLVQNDTVVNEESKKQFPSQAVEIGSLPTYPVTKPGPNLAQHQPAVPQPTTGRPKVATILEIPEEKPVHAVPDEQVRAVPMPKPLPMQISANDDAKTKHETVELATKPVFTTPTERIIVSEIQQGPKSPSKVHWTEPMIGASPTVVVSTDKKLTETNIARQQTGIENRSEEKNFEKRSAEFATQQQPGMRQSQPLVAPAPESPGRTEIACPLVRPVPDVLAIQTTGPTQSRPVAMQQPTNKIPEEQSKNLELARNSVKPEPRKFVSDRQQIEFSVNTQPERDPKQYSKQDLAQNRPIEIQETSRSAERIRNEVQTKPEQKQFEKANELAADSVQRPVLVAPDRNGDMPRQMLIVENRTENRSERSSQPKPELIAMEQKPAVEHAKIDVRPKPADPFPPKPPQQEFAQRVPVQKEIPANQPLQEHLPVFVPPAAKEQQQVQAATPQKTVDLANKLETLQRQSSPIQVEKPSVERTLDAQKSVPPKAGSPDMFSERKFDEALELLQQTDSGRSEIVRIQNSYPTGFASTQHGIVSAREWEELSLQSYSMPIRTESSAVPKTAQVIVRENAAPISAESAAKQTPEAIRQNAGFARSGNYNESVQKQRPRQQQVEHKPLIDWDRVRSLGEQKRRW